MKYLPITVYMSLYVMICFNHICTFKKMIHKHIWLYHKPTCRSCLYVYQSVKHINTDVNAETGNVPSGFIYIYTHICFYCLLHRWIFTLCAFIPFPHGQFLPFPTICAFCTFTRWIKSNMFDLNLFDLVVWYCELFLWLFAGMIEMNICCLEKLVTVTWIF